MADPTGGTPSPSDQPANPANPNPDPSNPNPSEPPKSQDGDPKRNNGTLYADLGEAEPGANGSPSWPSDWREQLAGKDDKRLGELKRYGSPTALADALFAAKQRIRSGEYTRAMPTSDKPEDIKAWREEQGLPVEPTGYNEIYEGYDKLEETDKKIVDSLNGAFFKGNVRPEVAQELVKTVHQLHLEQESAVAEKDAQNQEAVEDNLRAEWGPDYRPNLGANMQFLDKAFGQELADGILMARLPDGRRLSDIPEFNKKVNEWARAGGADIIIDTGQGGQSVDGRIAEIKKIMDTDFPKYAADKGMQEEYAKLLERQEKAGRLKA